jgi:hypothetical protein
MLLVGRLSRRVLSEIQQDQLHSREGMVSLRLSALTSVLGVYERVAGNVALERQQMIPFAPPSKHAEELCPV